MAPSSATGAATWSGPRIRQLCEGMPRALVRTGWTGDDRCCRQRGRGLEHGSRLRQENLAHMADVSRRDTGFDQYLDGSVEIQPPARPVNRLIDQAIAARDRSAPGRYVRRILYYVDTSITAAVRCCDGFTTLRSWCLTGQVKSVVLPLGPCAEPCLWA
jgi:hypothetical protein